MAMDPAGSGYVTGRVEELQRENETLREQLRRAGAQQTVARGALHEAVGEKEASARLAHQVAVEERATRAAVEVQSGNVGLSVILQILNFFMLLILLFGLFVWLPREVETRLKPAVSVVNPSAGTVTTPIR